MGIIERIVKRFGRSNNEQMWDEALGIREFPCSTCRYGDPSGKQSGTHEVCMKCKYPCSEYVRR